MPKRALITGISGQDGSYTAELLLSKGYEVHGVRRGSGIFNTSRIDHIIDDFRHDIGTRLFLQYADLTGSTLGTVRILEAIRETGIETRIYQASSSEMFGSTLPPQNEKSPSHPRSPAEVNLLEGDASKAKAQSGWEAQTRFSELLRILVDADVKLLDEQLARGELANEYSN